MPKIGKVSGFILVHGDKETEFSNVYSLFIEAKKIKGELKIYTVFEDYDGNKERKEGLSILATVNGNAFKSNCKNCGSPLPWMTRGDRAPIRDLCGACLPQEQEDAEVDVDEYLDSRRRADEY